MQIKLIKGSFLTESLVERDDHIILAAKKEYKYRSVVSTPVEIVKYMVKNTLAPICEKKTPEEIKNIQIADIACGSGIFLEEAYQFLVDYCTEWYMQHNPKHLLELSNGKKKLPLTDKKDILTRCIYGVDIDVHAVEVSKFSLLIKLIEDETPASVKECVPILPDLSSNIKNGNSLICREDISGKDMSIVDKEMSKSDLRKKAEIAPNTMTKLRRDEEVSLTILSKICKTLHADFGDIVEYVPDAEIWDLYNENRELLGKDHIRGEQLPIDGYHLVVHVWIRNSKGEYLISQRSANRPTYPLMWECVGGSVVKGEDSLQGAIREAKEEVGVDLIPESGQVLFTKTRKIIEGKIFNDIMDVWLFEYDGEVDLGNATTDEVAQVAWMNREQIKELFDANMFVDTLEYFFTEVDK